jgi:hypothetical protein
MSSCTLLRSTSVVLLCVLFASAHPVLADSNHARIVRLSLVQGDVRFARDVHGDPLASQTATWENAELNLPIRQGYVLATDKGRAEVEFENGAMAFLSEGTVLEFYDLSMEDGAKTTRLVLRQGTASFYVTPARGDYFSVTGGDFTVEATERANFRLNNFDDGSTVDVVRGHVNVTHKNHSTALERGQSLSMKANDSGAPEVGQLPASDDFDRWVSGRIDTSATATNAAQQYMGTSVYYSPGVADLYTYGSWYPMAGYGNCWRPYGVGLGWSPFDNGSWFIDPVYGTSFIGYQPWGWAPYHYGGWIFDPLLGWMWNPGAFGYGYLPWQPVTGVFVHPKNGPVGIVPVHPLDAKGKTPINLARGVFPVTNGAVGALSPVAPGEQWKVIKAPPQNTLRTNFVPAARPDFVSRTMAGGASSMAFDARAGRFVNNGAPVKAVVVPGGAQTVVNGPANLTRPVQTRANVPNTPTRTVSMPRSMTPPPVSRSAEAARGGYNGGGGGRSFGGGGSASAASSGGGRAVSAPSGGGGGGGGARPH